MGMDLVPGEAWCDTLRRKHICSRSNWDKGDALTDQ